MHMAVNMVKVVAQLWETKKQCLKEFSDSSLPVTVTDNKGNLIPRHELFYVSVVQGDAINKKFSSIRGILIDRLLPMVDGTVFTFQQFDDFVTQLCASVRSLGFELFPKDVQIPK